LFVNNTLVECILVLSLENPSQLLGIIEQKDYIICSFSFQCISLRGLTVKWRIKVNSIVSNGTNMHGPGNDVTFIKEVPRMQIIIIPLPIARLHSFPRDKLNKSQCGHVGVPDKRI
jgi:hypothetical protein